MKDREKKKFAFRAYGIYLIIQWMQSKKRLMHVRMTEMEEEGERESFYEFLWLPVDFFLYHISFT